MSKFVCPNCKEVHHIFRKGGGSRTAEEFDVELLGEIPIDSTIAEGMDEGRPFLVENPDSNAAKSFIDVGRNVAARLSTLHLADEQEDRTADSFTIEWSE